MKKILILSLLLLSTVVAHAQKHYSKDIDELRQPKLIVGLVVDQMRWDYLTRYADRYVDGGFRRLMREGYNCNRTFINYIPAITAVGHTSVYTGSVPSISGIVGNNFYIGKEYTYCTKDTTVLGIGTYNKDGQPDANVSAGKHSPRNLLVTTMTDQLRLATNFRSKTIGVALKNRASILPAGHAANAAYWMDENSTNFITSTYYMKETPRWVKDFNARKQGEKYVKEHLAIGNKRIKDGPWKLLYEEKSYEQSAKKDQAWEGAIGESLKLSPWGATITFDMARAAIEGENLGRNKEEVPDFLTISISSTDMIGHRVSPNSIWMEDTYLRLDKDLADFLTYLDQRVGAGNYLFFLTADHGGSHNPKFRQDHHIPGDTWKGAIIEDELNQALRRQFPSLSTKPIKSILNMQVYLSDEVRSSRQADAVITATVNWLRQREEVAYAFPANAVPDYVPEPIHTKAINGYNPHRSGDIQIIFRSDLTEDYASLDKLREAAYIYKGTTHGLWNPDDTHIPLIFFGWNVPHGWDNRTHAITDIATTVCALLNIQQPSGCVGTPIDFK